MANNKLSPQKYIMTKGRELPFHECFISKGWEERGMASIFISKKMPGGNYIPAMYLVDIFCLGLKNTFYNFNLSEPEYEEFVKKTCNHEPMMDCDIETAHNIIFGAIDYAEELGFKPNKDFSITEHLLDYDLITDGIDEIEFGRDGKPFFIAGPDDNIARIVTTLNNSVGEGNYDYMDGY